MKMIGKFVAKKLASLIVMGFLLVGGFFWVKSLFPNWFAGTLTSKYEFVIKSFEEESQLIVAGAEVDTTATHVFTNDQLQDWLKWTQKFTKVLVGRDRENRPFGLVIDYPSYF